MWQPDPGYRAAPRIVMNEKSSHSCTLPCDVLSVAGAPCGAQTLPGAVAVPGCRRQSIAGAPDARRSSLRRNMMMRILLRQLCTFVLLLPALAWSAATLDPEAAATVQQAWKLLDYVATDYAGAVTDGEVVDEAEYLEQQEFSATVSKLIERLPDGPARTGLQQQARALAAAVDGKVPPPEVDERAHALAAALLAAYPIPSAPERAPDLAVGAQLYQEHCASCHGERGDGRGPAGAGLDPPPIDFTDAGRADLRSPLSLYQATAQGIEDTAMAGYAGVLPDEAIWALAYYVGTLAYVGDASRGERAWQADAALRARVSSLDELSHARVAQLAPASGADTARAVIGWLRAHPEVVLQAPQGLALARAKLAASVAAWRQGEAADAVRLALSAYLDGVEPVEPRLDARDRALRAGIETAMGAYRSALSRVLPASRIEELAAAADAQLAEAERLLQDSSAGPATAFVGAFTILAREGLEALLVVVALLAFVHRAGRSEAARYVHYGWVLALLAGGVTWAIATWVVGISGASRELTEGLSSLFAAAVLLGVGLWMHDKSVGGRWQQYLKQKMDAALQRRSGWFLFALAFVSVYREVFETILFYAALWADGEHLWVLAGMLAAVATLAVVAWIMLRTSRRLPIARFFLASSILIVLLAFVMTGKGIAALQEAGWVGVSLAPVPRVDWLGIHPTWQTTVAQLLILALVLAGLAWNVVRGRRRAALAH